MFKAFIGLGSNIGNREQFLEQAIRLLHKQPQIAVTRLSSIYETEPYGPVKQEPFLNMVAEIQTSLPPHDLLQVTQDIERRLKRERLIRWGPRTIDLDILTYADKMIETDSLVIPHPEITKRLFVLVPLCDLEPDLVLACDTLTVKERLKGFGRIKGVQLWKKNNGVGEFGLFES